MWKIEDRKELLTAPITLPPLDEQTLSELRQQYDEAADAETRTHYQMLLLAQRGQTSTQIAEIVLRSQDTLVRVLKRFLTGWLETIPRRSSPGRDRMITQVWESELLHHAEVISIKGRSKRMKGRLPVGKEALHV